MGMSAGVYRVSEAEIQKLLEAPDSVEASFDAATWAPPTREVRPKGILADLKRRTTLIG